MRLTKDEKEKLFELLDVITEKYPSESLDKLLDDDYLFVYYSIFKKLRLELKGY